MSDFKATTTLRFSKDSMSNTTITSENNSPFYIVNTQTNRRGAILRICDSEGIAIATVDHKITGIVSTKLTWGNERSISLDKWLSKSWVPFNDDINFKDDADRRYRWKCNAPGGGLQLFTEADHFKQPIARFCKSAMTYVTDPPSLVPATLALTLRAEEIRDSVVVSFLLVERGNRGAGFSGSGAALYGTAAF